MSSQTLSILGDAILGTLIEHRQDLRDCRDVVPEENTSVLISGWNTGSYFFLASYDCRSARYDSKVGGDLSDRIDDRR